MRVDRDRFLCALAAVGGVLALPSTPSAAQTAAPRLPHTAGDGSDGAPSPAGPDDGAACRGKHVTRPATCDDLHGSPGDCRKADCRRLPFICEHCEDYKRFLKPKIAERAVACVVAQTGPQLGDGCRTYQCGDEALAGACIDPMADPACLVVSRACNVTMDACRGLLSGMNDAGRAKVVGCAASGCQFGLWSCVEGL
jgi:hypothetical protein